MAEIIEDVPRYISFNSNDIKTTGVSIIAKVTLLDGDKYSANAGQTIKGVSFRCVGVQIGDVEYEVSQGATFDPNQVLEMKGPNGDEVTIHQSSGGGGKSAVFTMLPQE